MDACEDLKKQLERAKQDVEKLNKEKQQRDKEMKDMIEVLKAQ